MDEDGGPLIYLIAGEASGDSLGAGLMAGLKSATGGKVRFAGIGGPRMTGHGLESFFPMAELSLMGLTEVLPHAPRLLRRIRETADDIAERRPDVVVTIDAPGFVFRVIKKLRALPGPPVPCVHYVAPQVWAWRPRRAAKVAKLVDHLLTLLPFEPPYFEREGLPTTFVGHPVVEGSLGQGDGPGFRARHGLAAQAPLVCVLPGSRRGEVSRLTPVFGQALALLAADRPGLQAVIPTLDHVAPDVRALTSAWPVKATLLRGEPAKADAFAASDVALAASGTVSLELALAGLPAVIAYRMNPVTAFIGMRMLQVPYVTLVNLLAERGAVPECLQGQCTPARLAGELSRLLDDPAARADQAAAYAQATDLLAGPGPTASDAAARTVLSVIGRAAAQEA